MHAVLPKNRTGGGVQLPEHFQKRVLCRISDPFVLDQLRIVVEHGIVEQIAVRLLRKIQLRPVKHPAIHIDLLHRHLILRQRPRLVRTDHRDTAQALHCLQILDDRIFLRHLLRSKCLHDRDDGAQRFRDRCHGESHRKHHRIQKRHLPIPAEREHDHADCHDQHRQPAAELIQTLLQGRLSLLRLVHQSRDLSELRVHPGVRHQHLRTPVRDKTSRIHHVGAVRQRRRSLKHRVGLVDVQRFARQRAFIDL